MLRLTPTELEFISLCLEGFMYGIYSGIFIIYLQYQGAKKDTNKTENVIFYSICILYVLSVVLFGFDIAQVTLEALTTGESMESLGSVQGTLFGCCDFIAQIILIYRCWIVWRRNIHAVIIPSILATVFLVIWLVPSGKQHFVSNESLIPYWASVLTLVGLALSVTVNALVMAAIIFRIFMVFREVRATSDDRVLGASGGNKLRDIIFILIESGTALFAIQLARVVLTIVATLKIQDIIIGIHEMFTGITPTFILVRTTMGLSFDEDRSIEEVAIGSLHFVSNHANSIPEIGSNIDVDEDRRDDDDISILQENDIEVVGR